MRALIALLRLAPACQLALVDDGPLLAHPRGQQPATGDGLAAAAAGAPRRAVGAGAPAHGSEGGT